MKVSRLSTASALAAALVAVASCSACGSSAPPPPTTSTLRQEFLAVVNRTDATLSKDTDNSHPATTDMKYARAFTAAADQVQALDFPASMEPEARAEVTALKALATYAEATGKAAAKNQNVKANVIAMARINLKLLEAEKTETKTSNALRHVLGLPPETTTTTTSTTAPVLKSP
jgi:hypothetical protein